MPKMCYQFANDGNCTYGARCRFQHRQQTTRVHTNQPDGVDGASHAPSVVGKDILEKYFAAYPSFNHDVTASSSKEFYRMCDFFGWDRNDDERQEAHRNFRTALVRQFNAIYGTDVTSLATWQSICVALDVEPLPNSPTAAKKILKGKFVNLVDLVDRANTGKPVTQFVDLDHLQQYTISTGKYFPKDSAYAGGMLRFLLREILHHK